MKQWKDNWPFLSNDPEVQATADKDKWELYFRGHLGGFPASYVLFRDGVIRYLNMPEAKPETFDPTYVPRVVELRPERHSK